MFNKRISKLKENSDIVGGILSLDNQKDMHKQLDVLVNSTRIFYTSREDFEKNYPKKNDLNGKIDIILKRRI